MRQVFPVQRNVFSLLLCLEWLLLGIAVLAALLPNPMNRFTPLPLLTIPAIAALGLMGLCVPKDRLIVKLLYTSLEFGLIILLHPLNSGVGLFPLLYLIVAIRSCGMFQPRGRLVVAGLTFLSFVLTIFSACLRYRVTRLM